MDNNNLKQWCEQNLYRDDGWFDGNKSSEKWYIKNNSIEIYNVLMNFKEKDNLTKIAEVAYWLKHDIDTPPVCLVCHTQLRFYGKGGFIDFISTEGIPKCTVYKSIKEKTRLYHTKRQQTFAYKNGVEKFIGWRFERLS